MFFLKIKRRIFCNAQKLYKVQIPVFLNKVLLRYSYTHLFVYCLWLLSRYDAELTTYNRGYVARKPKYTLSGPLQKKLADACFRKFPLPTMLPSSLIFVPYPMSLLSPSPSNERKKEGGYVELLVVFKVKELCVCNLIMFYFSFTFCCSRSKF